MDFEEHPDVDAAGLGGTPGYDDDYLLLDPFTLRSLGYQLLAMAWFWLFVRLLLSSLWVSKGRSWQLSVLWARLMSRGSAADDGARRKKTI